MSQWWRALLQQNHYHQHHPALFLWGNFCKNQFTICTCNLFHFTLLNNDVSNDLSIKNGPGTIDKNSERDINGSGTQKDCSFGIKSIIKHPNLYKTFLIGNHIVIGFYIELLKTNQRMLTGSAFSKSDVKAHLNCYHVARNTKQYACRLASIQWSI